MSDPTPACCEALVGRIRKLCRPLQPNPTGQAPHLAHRNGIRAVLFDVYGTLLVSGSGDVGTAMAMDNVAGFSDALRVLDLSRDVASAARSGVDRLFSAIAEAHALRKEKGVVYPEVDIRSIWQRVLCQLAEDGLTNHTPEGEEILRFAVEYECRVNPVWPMPGMADTLAWLRDSGRTMGIVSNAQFFTPLLFDALAGASVMALGFDARCCAWSYETLEAKPSVAFFRRALEALGRTHGIQPHETLYVGNDMRNDMWPAAECGCATALFAGDVRSLRLREDDADCAGVKPDVILTDLTQLRTVLR